MSSLHNKNIIRAYVVAIKRKYCHGRLFQDHLQTKTQIKSKTSDRVSLRGLVSKRARAKILLPGFLSPKGTSMKGPGNEFH